MTTSTPIKSLCYQRLTYHRDRNNLSEVAFLKRVNMGFLATGNSAYDLLEQVCKVHPSPFLPPFLSFDTLADYFVVQHEETGDLPEELIDESITFWFDAVEQLAQNHPQLLAG